MSTTDPDITTLFDRLVERVADEGVVAGEFFGLPAFTLGDLAIGCFQNRRLAVRLGRETPAHAAALNMPGATVFDPSGKNNPFRDWVSVPAFDEGYVDDDFDELLQAAVAFARA